MTANRDPLWRQEPPTPLTDDLPQLVQRLRDTCGYVDCHPDAPRRACTHCECIAALDTLTHALAEAQETAHYANGVAELAMKHRDAAEQELRELRDQLHDESLERQFYDH